MCQRDSVTLPSLTHALGCPGLLTDGICYRVESWVKWVRPGSQSRALHSRDSQGESSRDLAAFHENPAVQLEQSAPSGLVLPPAIMRPWGNHPITALQPPL